MGFDIESSDQLFNGYLSYNFSKFNKYWYIRDHLQGKDTRTVINNLVIAIQKLKSAGFVPILNKDDNIWTSTENVFVFILQQKLNEIRNILANNPDHINAIYGVDGDYTNKPINSNTNQTETITNTNTNTNVKIPVVFYQGNRVETYEKACQIFTSLLLEEDPNAYEWLEVARKFKNK